jgi:lysyl-tRNA synthetase class 2
MSIPHFEEKYRDVPEGKKVQDAGVVNVAGRVLSIRASGPSLYFMNLHADGKKIQVMAQRE